jgi:hypothetical protein
VSSRAVRPGPLAGIVFSSSHCRARVLRVVSAGMGVFDEEIHEPHQRESIERAVVEQRTSQFVSAFRGGVRARHFEERGLRHGAVGYARTVVAHADGRRDGLERSRTAHVWVRVVSAGDGQEVDDPFAGGHEDGREIREGLGQL